MPSELREQIEVSRDILNLRVSTIEKDYYLTKSIHALSLIKNENF